MTDPADETTSLIAKHLLDGGRCPDCASDRVTCVISAKTHVHRCHDCGLEDAWKATARP
jgi:Zn ribbon nucleic-acid-binding protein